ncbi:zinc finger BED domain-containing protein RICESLEEPER 2-like [Chenopodium quinoa]|uniref:zinc finger BED domain-containing protein RICESLEEPER 2-like n=1 Tax=Chenopodium quinoa TaxID=63459 RepID=UPI000B7831CD|nr:zinc finger BED domain-containing protein RICESLEEPER 2-like [Chenopodium quinoa]
MNNKSLDQMPTTKLITMIVKHVRLPFYDSNNNTSCAFDIIHADLWTSSIRSINGHKYYLILLDDFTHYMWAILLAYKSQVFQCFIHFRQYVQTVADPRFCESVRFPDDLYCIFQIMDGQSNVMDSIRSNECNETNDVPLAGYEPNDEEDWEGFVDKKDTTHTSKEVSSSTSTKSKKKTSDVWDCFDIVIINGIEKAQCKYCRSALSYNGNNGTSHLRKHALKSCSGKHLKLAAGQSQLKVKTEVDGTTSLSLKEKKKKVTFDQDVSRRELVKMVVIHEYPLSIVDHIGFRSFVKSLNDNFKFISRNTLRNDVMRMYNNDRSSLKELLEANEGRVAITTDMWTASNQKKGFCFVPCPHTKGVIAKVLMDTLSQFSLENKISSIVLDNCTTNDSMINVLLEKLESSCLVLDGEFLHMRCSAHILNLIVKDGLEVIDHAIVKVRECIAFWMSTPKRIKKFEEACRLLNVTKPKRVGLDCKTRWNSTYLMLESSLPFKEVFNKLKRLNKKLKFSVPSEDDWTMTTLVCQKLEIFYKATKVFSIRNQPTVNLLFRIVCGIKLALDRWVQIDNDEVIRRMAKSMVEKFDKYWSHINGILAIAAILDPRNKMDCVVHYFGKLYGDGANSEIARIRKTLDDLVSEFQSKNEVVSEQSSLMRGFYECGEEEDDFAISKRLL